MIDESLDALFEGHNNKPSIKIRDVPSGSRFVIVSDQQVPLEDKSLLWTIFNDFVPDFKPYGVTMGVEYHLFLNGDIIDNFSLSSFLQRVFPKFTLGDEVDMVRAYLKSWKKHFTHKHFIFGNHEARWEREIYVNNPKMARFTPGLEEVLELDKLGYDWVPYLKHYDFEGFIITHGDTAIKHAAAKMMLNYQASGVSGHANRPQSYTWADAASGEPATWYVEGMTCRKDIGEVIKAWAKIQPWQQGFMIGEVKDGVGYVQLIRVHHGHFYANGKIYKVRDASEIPSE